MIFKPKQKILFPIVGLVIFAINFFVIIFVFFILISNVDISSGFLVDLPQSKLGQVILGNKLNMFISQVKKNDQEQITVYVNNQIMSWQNLELSLIDYIRSRRVIGNKNNKPVLALKVDKEVDYKHLIHIFHIANKLGLVINHVVESN